MNMNCERIQTILDDRLLFNTSAALPEDAKRHLQTCEACQRYRDEIQNTLTGIRPVCSVSVPPNLQARIMNDIRERDRAIAKKGFSIPIPPRFRRPLFALGLTAFFVLLAPLIDVGIALKERWMAGSAIPANVLLSQAWAFEFASFRREGVVRFTNEITVEALPYDSLLVERWFPVCEVRADGQIVTKKIRFPKKHTQSYRIEDDTRYDFASRQFVRTLSIEGRVVYLNAFYGGAIYSLAQTPDGIHSVERNAVSESFQSPHPEEFLGLTAGLPSAFDEGDDVRTVNRGKGRLDDGTAVRVVRTKIHKSDDSYNYLVFNINEKTSHIEGMDRYLYRDRLVRFQIGVPEELGEARMQWNPQEFTIDENALDLMRIDDMSCQRGFMTSSLERMAAQMERDVYVPSTSPLDYGLKAVYDLFDLGSPSNRIFLTIYESGSGPDIVLVHSQSLNDIYGPKAKALSRHLYTSPNGTHVWSNPFSGLAARLVLQTASLALNEEVHPECSGYLLESGTGSFFGLAVNGKLPRAELQSFADNLVNPYGGPEES